MRERVAHRVLVILGRDMRHGVERAAVALAVLLRGHAEDLREAQLLFVVVVLVAGAGQRAGDVGGGAVRHLLRTHHEYGLRLAGEDRVHAGMNGGRAGGAGVLGPARGLETQLGIGLVDQRGREAVADHAGIEVAEKHRVDVFRRDAGFLDRLAGGLDDQRLEVVFQPAEPGMATADDRNALIHVVSLE